MSDEPVSASELTTLQAEVERLRGRVWELEEQETAIAEPTQLARQKALLAVVTKIRQSLDLDTIFQSTATEVRQLLNADRVGMYRFELESDYQWGEFVSEDVLPPFPSALAARINDCCFGENHARYYRDGRIWSCDDLYTQDLKQCHINILERFQVRANLVVPLLKGDELWGLLCIHHCSSPRHWQDEEIEFVSHIALHLGVALQQAEVLAGEKQQSEQLAAAVAQAVEREQAIAAIITKIRQSLDLDTIFRTTTDEVRHLLRADRVVIYRFNSDWSGEFVVDSVDSCWKSLIVWQHEYPEWNEKISQCSLKNLETLSVTDTHLKQTEGAPFKSSHSSGNLVQVFRVCEDIYEKGFSQCYVETLESYQARAYAIVAIYQHQKLWGLLAAFQNSGPRNWQEGEVNFLIQIGSQLGVAIQQAQLLARMEQRSTELKSTLDAELKKRASELEEEAQRERAIAEVIDKIRRTLELERIFATATTEVRSLLNADRVAIFEFNPESNWHDGRFVSEAVLPEFESTLAKRVRDCSFREDYYDVDYPKGQIQAIADIYNSELSDSYIAILSQFQIQATLVLPLVKGEYLWGLLCIHQCSEPRQWQVKEIEFTRKIAIQLGVALQQADLFAHAQKRSSELRATLADLNAIVDNLADGLLVTDTQRQITRFNPAFLQMFNLQPEELEGRRLRNVCSVELDSLMHSIEHRDTEIVTVDVKLGNNREGQALATSIIKEGEGKEGDQCIGSVILIRDVTVEREVDRMKTDFLTTVSHELRTPLTSVLGFTEMIQEKLEETLFPAIEKSDKKIQRSIQTVQSNINIIISESERLTSLINDVLDISKMESGNVNWNIQKVDPLEILDRAIAATSSLIEKNHLAFIKDFDPDLPSIEVDRDRIIQVAINLISNAVKFTKEGSITCKAVVSGRDLIVSIIDTGIGISTENQVRVFDRFKQVGDILTDKPKGTGLGLSICQQIIEYHGGKIWVDSQLDRGSTFSFSIPLESSQALEENR
ncbi:GAF domain-containing protein [Roseofilum casamattae]|uniref:histidine kinase n=1 Tax=Roseofilum casamattae BLCC-M143 TaxID=3022442 RepID=A0ABT7BWK9_9CYAN|nr:GAF domain-containing protein [Roseofilum casamattae]MDJ1183583.1 GAF domain-containing protein [Roseofilum casamattae BLCC-M143]